MAKFVGKKILFLVFFFLTLFAFPEAYGALDKTPPAKLAESPEATHKKSSAPADPRTLSQAQLLEGDDADADEEQWDDVYNQKNDYVYGREPAPFLVEVLSLLPPSGRVLDLGMGEGRNAVFLAARGFFVEGIDISKEALRRARKLAREKRTRIRAIHADLNHYKLAENSYDVVLIFYYLNRNILPSVKKCLRPGGVVVFENNTVHQLRYDKKVPRSDLVESGELKQLFAGFEVLKYRESDNGHDAIASLVARKPKK